MGPDLHAASAVARCPACAGAVRADAPWCTQCWTDLRPAVAPAPAPVPEPVAPRPTAVGVPAAREARDQADQADQPDQAPSWPCAACGTRTALDQTACAACGTPFLASLRAQEEPLLVLPVVGDLSALSRAARLGLAGAVVLLVLLVTALGGVLLP